MRRDPGDDDHHRETVVAGERSNRGERERLAALHITQHETGRRVGIALRRNALPQDGRGLSRESILAVAVERQVLQQLLNFGSLKWYPQASRRKLLLWNDQLGIIW